MQEHLIRRSHSLVTYTRCDLWRGYSGSQTGSLVHIALFTSEISRTPRSKSCSYPWFTSSLQSLSMTKYKDQACTIMCNMRDCEHLQVGVNRYKRTVVSLCTNSLHAVTHNYVYHTETRYLSQSTSFSQGLVIVW